MTCTFDLNIKILLLEASSLWKKNNNQVIQLDQFVFQTYVWKKEQTLH